MPETTVASFVLRFTQEHTSEGGPASLWRGAIRHVQSDEEVRFARLEDALAFIERYVDLNDELSRQVREE